MILPNVDSFLGLDKIEEVIRNLLFHLGMVELVSYWKATCSPEVIVKPHHLDEWQAGWWKKLYFNGLGEFFYINKIETDIGSYMQIDGFGEKGSNPLS